jgi:hypothetical protein
LLRVLRAGRRLGIVAAVRPTGAVVAGRFFSLGRDLLDDLASQDIVDVADDVSDVLDENFRLSTKHDVILIAHTRVKINSINLPLPVAPKQPRVEPRGRRRRIRSPRLS